MFISGKSMVIFQSAESWLYALQLSVAEGVQTPNLSSSQMITGLGTALGWSPPCAPSQPGYKSQGARNACRWLKTNTYLGRKVQTAILLPGTTLPKPSSCSREQLDPSTAASRWCRLQSLTKQSEDRPQPKSHTSWKSCTHWSTLQGVDNPFPSRHLFFFILGRI